MAVIYRGDWWSTSWPALFYTSNYATIQDPASMGWLFHTWSLAIEEHFYLVWPLIVTFTPERNRVKVFVGLAVAAVLWRLYLTASGETLRLYFGTDANAAALLAGCVLAVTNIRPRPLLGWAAAAGLVVLAAVPGPVTTASLGYVGLAAVAVHSPPPIFEAAWLRWFGTISYGLYLWHWPLLVFGWWMAPVAVLVAWISWKLIEQPILQRDTDTSLIPSRQ